MYAKLGNLVDADARQSQHNTLNHV